MQRYYYDDTIAQFLSRSTDEIIGQLTRNSDTVEQAQRIAWESQIEVLKPILDGREGHLFFEFSIPRMGKRIDVVLIINHAVFILEFKTGETKLTSQDLDQVMDYALDLKNFHEPSAHVLMAPILLGTTGNSARQLEFQPHRDNLLRAMRVRSAMLPKLLDEILLLKPVSNVDAARWGDGQYKPTPTIIEAALALYSHHSVEDITRQEAGAINIGLTSKAVTEIIQHSRDQSHKSICFVTGVPGAGKTLVGLNIATNNFEKDGELHSVFLSGNLPLVAVLSEALARNHLANHSKSKSKRGIGEARRAVKLFIQSVHHFRDDKLIDQAPPDERVLLFDEAQRAWTMPMTADFMKRKRGVAHFQMSEPEFLISCVDRHEDWGVVICLVGGGQEIHRGEAGISEWLRALEKSFPTWDVYISSRLSDAEYAADGGLRILEGRENITFMDELHLSVSMRSFRSENVSRLVKQILDLEEQGARETLESVLDNYPIAITRDPTTAKKWILERAAGTERYGMLASSGAYRLRPLAITVLPKEKLKPIHWFLAGKEDIRSSFYLEEAATEFQVQGLELDWACVTWDADLRYSHQGWDHWNFKGSKWQRVKKPENQQYLQNAYRVLLTRARQGMVLVVPEGSTTDKTRDTRYYDETFEYLRGLGIPAA